jgi:hypothetical protein
LWQLLIETSSGSEGVRIMGSFRKGRWLGLNYLDPQVAIPEVTNYRNQLRKQMMEAGLGYILPPFLKRWIVSINDLIKCYICLVCLTSNAVSWMSCSSNHYITAEESITIIVSDKYPRIRQCNPSVSQSQALIFHDKKNTLRDSP